MTRPTSQGWIILRTAGRSTLGLAGSLARDGFRVWTPKGLPDSPRRAPRSRRRRTPDIGLIPILPTFIFASECHLGDLIELSHQGRFSITHDLNRQRGFAVIADCSLAHLRGIEERAEAEASRRRPRLPVQPFDEGEAIKVPAGAYQGMSGLVESSDGKTTWLHFGGIMGRVRIETFRLRPDEELRAA